MTPVPVTKGGHQPLDKITVTQYNVFTLDIKYQGLGENAVQNVSTAGSLFVKEINVNFHGSGAITLRGFQHCPDRRPPMYVFPTPVDPTRKPPMYSTDGAHGDEKKFPKDLQCSGGFWGERHVEIEESDGQTVQCRQPFARPLNELGI